MSDACGRADDPATQLDFVRLAGVAVRQAAMFAHSTDEREAIAQEALARAWERRDRFDPARGPAESWLFGLIRNVAREQHRAARRNDNLWQRLVGRDTPESDERTLLVDAVERLSLQDQEILFLKFWVGLSHREIGDRLGTTSAACRQRLRRAVTRLGRQLR